MMTYENPSSTPSSTASLIEEASLRKLNLEFELMSALSHSAELAHVQGSPSDWDTACHHQWDLLEDTLEVIQHRSRDMHAAIMMRDAPGARHACAAWAMIQDKEAKLTLLLASMGVQCRQLNETACQEWQVLLQIVGANRQLVHTASEGLGEKLKTWQKELMESLAAGVMIPTALPERDGSDETVPVVTARSLDHAAVEIEDEQHQALDLKDSIKAMFMWVETPEERLLKNRPSPVRSASRGSR